MPGPSLALGGVDLIFAEASEVHSSGADLARAETLYRKVLAAQPQHAHALHQLGALLTQMHGKAKYDEALRLIVAAVQLQPSCAKFRNSLGVVHQTAAQWREAADAFERANEKDPMNVAILMNLARALREIGRQQRAAEVYGAVAKLQPDHPSANYRRGAILRSLRRNEEALASFRQHLRLHPDHQASRFWVAAITGDAEAMAAAPSDMVAGLFDQYADHFDDHLVNKLQYRTPEALRNQLLAMYCSDRGVTAANGSGPGAPSDGGRTAPLWRRCVDLGCGTGLMGPLLLPYCDALEGVDLSAGMIDQAAKRGCYSRLAVSELVAYLDKEAVALGQKQGEDGDGKAVAPSQPPTTARDAAAERGIGAVPYDLLVAADVFVYIGNLLPVMRAAAAVAAPGAVLAFSTEALELAPLSKAHRGLQPSTCSGGATGCSDDTNIGGTAAGGAESTCDDGGDGCNSSDNGSRGDGDGSRRAGCPGLRLQVTGRYAHSEAYLRRTGLECGWQLASVSQSVIRLNGGEPITGHLCIMVLEPSREPQEN